MIAVVSPEQRPDETSGVLWAGLLRTGGTLAVLTHSDHHGSRLTDPTGPIVAAAQNADLLYLQHIVAVHHPLHAPPADPRPATVDDRGAESETHRRSHSDLLVFGQLAGHAGSYFTAAAGRAA